MKLIVVYAGENLRSILLEKLKENKSLNCRLSNKDLAEKIKVKIFKTWINIRANSFVKPWISIARREVSDEIRASSYSKAGQLSLRKSLNS